jgi:hypothetical protein
MRLRVVLLAVVLSFSKDAFAKNRDLINEVEQLLQSIPVNDQDSKRSLNIKLARLWFKESMDLAGKPQTTAKETRDLELAQTRAITLHKNLLTGGANVGGEKPTGELEAELKFQLSRLYADRGDLAPAKSIWAELKDGVEYPSIAFNSALWLAENTETDQGSANAEKALSYYRHALKLSQSKDATAYIHYKIAWTLGQLNKVNEAIDQMKLSLWDSKEQIREESLRDLIQLYTQSSYTADQAIGYFEDLAAKIRRPELIQTLADAYLAAGNKPVAVAVLSRINSKKPNFKNQVQLLEESYGSRDWDLFNRTLEQISNTKPEAYTGEELKTQEPAMRRLLVQLDAETRTNPKNAEDLIALSETYVKLYPKSDIRVKVVQSRISVDTQPDRKIAAIEAALASTTLGLSAAESLQMREQLVTLYQKKNDRVNAAKHLAILAGNAPDQKEKRRFSFVRAMELYDLKNFAESETLLKQVVAGKNDDDMALKSQLFLTRIFAKEGRFADIMASVDAWTKTLPANVAFKQSAEFKEITDVRSKSEFESAVKSSEEEKNLATFKKFCFAKEHLPKSCENAKHLAIKLKKHAILVELLQNEGKELEIAELYESIGDLAEAGRIYEKLNLNTGKAQITDYIKVGLLYEIGGDREGQVRVLNALQKKLGTAAVQPQIDEGLLLATLNDAQLVNVSTLKLGWNETTKCHLADKLYAQNNSTALKQQIMACKVSSGPSWGQIVTAELTALDQSQRKVTFKGNNSKAMFQKRVKMLGALNDTLTKYYTKADLETRKFILNMGHKAYADLVTEIKATPIPEGLTPEELQQVENSLTELSAPFAQKVQEFAERIAETEKETPPQVAEVKQATPVDARAKLDLFKALRTDPENTGALAQLKDLYAKNGHWRQAAYFEGRLSSPITNASKEGDRREGH